MLPQRLMEHEEGRRREDDGTRWDPSRIQEERGQTEQKAVAGDQRWGASAGALMDQHLMCQQQGLGGHRADPPGRRNVAQVVSRGMTRRNVSRRH